MSKRVIIVDDSKFLVRQIVQFFEQQLEFEVVATGNDGNDAVELYRKHKPDLITLDITMPNKDGQQAMLEILEDFPDANILMISAVRGGAMLECMSSGAKGYVEKPLKFGDTEFVEDFKESVMDVFNTP
ncbi:Chemotaxis regulator [Chitinispirillum alkaliphilum]|nr:Chemotaxis regulator [Chitinispirillum alkaliphilum]